MKNTNVLFPKEYDARSFFSDVDLDHVQLMNDHHSYVGAKQFKMASKIAESSEQDYYGAYLFNAIEARLKSIGEYLSLRKLSVEKVRPVYQEEKPKDFFLGMIWLSSIDLDGVFAKGDPPRSLYLSIDKPEMGLMHKNDIWLNIEQPDVFVDKENTKKYYQHEKPTDAQQYNVWLSDMDLE